MQFISLEFLAFMPAVFVLYWFVFNRTIRLQNTFLLASSYFFYGWWSYKFLLLLIVSTLLDYLYGFGVGNPNKKKARLFLWLSILNNLGILAFFKYYDFFISEVAAGLSLLGLGTNLPLLNIVLPVGISFYTFHGMSYVFDIYRGLRQPVRSFTDYAVFVSFFPLLVAGPIERANHLLPQVQMARVFSYEQAVSGCRLVLWGLFKKVVIADTLGNTANYIFDNYQNFENVTLIIGVLAFSFQIYGDFSGYSDIALGTAKLLGFELLSNFRFPYFSRNLAEFWRRWHISLTSWFRDYLYIPMGGSAGGKLRTVFNTVVIFIVSGLWHGANWKYIVWGGIHALGFIPLLLTGQNRKYRGDVVAVNRSFPNLKELCQMGATFIYVAFAWIFFRSASTGQALDYIGRIFRGLFQHTAGFLNHCEGEITLVYIAALLLIDWKFRRDERSLAIHHNRMVRYSVYVVTTTLIITHLRIFDAVNSIEFIYFQF